LIESPVARWGVTSLQGIFFAIEFEPIVGTDVNALSFPREYLAPPFHRPSALAIEEILRALRLGTEKGDLQKGAVPAAAAA
jgi:hypothetical protein